LANIFVFFLIGHNPIGRNILIDLGHQRMSTFWNQTKYTTTIGKPKIMPPRVLKRLFVVVFYPCHGHHRPCTRWAVDEWWGTTRGDAHKDKRRDVRYFDTPEEGIEFYKDIIAEGPRVSRYNIETCRYEGESDSNIVITNSHTICDKCKEARDAERNRSAI
jgi:hypothetical protein